MCGKMGGENASPLSWSPVKSLRSRRREKQNQNARKEEHRMWVSSAVGSPVRLAHWQGMYRMINEVFFKHFSRTCVTGDSLETTEHCSRGKYSVSPNNPIGESMLHSQGRQAPSKMWSERTFIAADHSSSAYRSAHCVGTRLV